MERLVFFKARQQAKPAKAQKDCVWERPGACSALQVHLETARMLVPTSAMIISAPTKCRSNGYLSCYYDSNIENKSPDQHFQEKVVAQHS